MNDDAGGKSAHERPVGRLVPERAGLTPLKRRIVDLLAMQPRQRMCYYSMGLALWPPHLFPKAARYSSNGGPPGWAMPLGRALRELSEAGLVHEHRRRHGGPGHGDIELLKPPNEPIERSSAAKP